MNGLTDIIERYHQRLETAGWTFSGGALPSRRMVHRDLDPVELLEWSATISTLYYEARESAASEEEARMAVLIQVLDGPKQELFLQQTRLDEVDEASFTTRLCHAIAAKLEPVPAFFVFNGKALLERVTEQAANRLVELGVRDNIPVRVGLLSIIPQELRIEQEPGEPIEDFIGRAVQAAVDLANVLNIWVDNMKKEL